MSHSSVFRCRASSASASSYTSDSHPRPSPADFVVASTSSSHSVSNASSHANTAGSKRTRCVCRRRGSSSPSPGTSPNAPNASALARPSAPSLNISASASSPRVFAAFSPSSPRPQTPVTLAAAPGVFSLPALPAVGAGGGSATICHGASPCSARYRDTYASSTLRRRRHTVGESGNFASRASRTSVLFFGRARSSSVVAFAFVGDEVAFATPGDDPATLGGDPLGSDDSETLDRESATDGVSIACTTSMPLSHRRSRVSSTNVSGSTCASSMARLETPAWSRYARSLSCQLPSRTRSNAPCDHRSPSVT